MYSKHRQKNAQLSPAKYGRLFVFLYFLLLNGTLDKASGNTGEQGKEELTCRETSPSVYQLRAGAAERGTELHDVFQAGRSVPRVGDKPPFF